MLKHVHKALLQAEVITLKSNLLFNVTITTGDAISMEIHDDIGGSWFHVKASRFNDLETQFDRYQCARRHYSNLAPEPVTLVRIDGWSIMATRSIDHRCLIAQDLGVYSPRKQLIQDLIGFFSAARKLANDNGTLYGHDSLLNELNSYFTKTRDSSSKVSGFLDTLNAGDLSSIPAIPQHGDFVLNNLGMTHGRLVVFDWEDYGELMLAGFDIFMLCMSVSGMNGASAMAIAQTEYPDAAPWAFAVPACAVSELPYDTFRKMVPLYLTAFSYLKRNYGQEIRQRVNCILDDILS